MLLRYTARSHAAIELRDPLEWRPASEKNHAGTPRGHELAEHADA